MLSKKAKKYAIPALVGVGMLVAADVASAQALGDALVGITNRLVPGAEKFLAGLSYGLGIWNGFKAAMAWKNHNDNPQQNPAANIWKTAVLAVVFVTLPSVFGMGIDTIYGNGGGQVLDASGSNGFNINSSR